MFAPSVIQLSRAALHNNIRFLRKQIGKHVILASVIKGDAYGHSIKLFVPLAESCGVRHFFVFSADEAVLAKNHRQEQESRICIMGHIADESLEWAVEQDIEFWVFDLQRLEAAVAAARRVAKPARIHFELETGMHRVGLQGIQFDDAMACLKANRQHLELVGTCTHFAGAESIQNHLRIQCQLAAFDEGVETMRRAGLNPGLRHSACSSAALVIPDSQMDMVRFGITQYGFWPSEETRMRWHLAGKSEFSGRMRDPLKRVLRWTSRVMNIKTVSPGCYVGYGNTHMTKRTEKLAAVPVGYHHGFDRGMSNLGFVLIHGRRAPVVGLVNMNMILVDVTDIPQAERGDEVVIIGKQKRQEITVSSFSDMTRNLSYEVLVRLPASIPRVVVD